MKIAARKGCFIVSMRYRDDNLRLRCNNLVKAGLMRRTRTQRGMRDAHSL